MSEKLALLLCSGENTYSAAPETKWSHFTLLNDELTLEKQQH
jgi:hypothetical protein